MKIYLSVLLLITVLFIFFTKTILKRLITDKRGLFLIFISFLYFISVFSSAYLIFIKGYLL